MIYFVINSVRLLIATIYHHLAALYSKQGRYSQAEPLSKKALELRQRLLGEEHLDVATIRENLKSLRDNYA
ncbi:tetratricopeptide repeat protein [Nostoc sp.]